jgi:NAD(P)H-dependent flavin oxidoreductase YrpB (nitropropane dioxygenase family)
MQWVGTAQMAAAVSNAGGLGIVSALTQPTPQRLGIEIDKCRELTNHPFGVNVTMLRSVNPPPYEEIIGIIIERNVRVVETSGNVPLEIFETLNQAGITIIHKCTSVRHAISAEKKGVHIVTIDGFECAGHPGEEDIPGLILIPASVSALTIPVIASGGIADGRGLAAALCLGASGICMGTRFVATKEAPVHEKIKLALVNAHENDTRLMFRTLGNTARVLSNKVSNEVIALETRPDGCTFDELRLLVSGARGRQTLVTGEIDSGVIWAGQVVGLINDIPTCRVLIERMVKQCNEQLAVASSMF